MNPFHATVSALGYSIVRERCRPTDTNRDWPYNRAVRFVQEQHGRMPGFLQFPFAAVTVVFSWSSIVRHGKPFHKLPHEVRWRQIEAWRNAPLGPCRDLIRFYESFVIFYWHSTRADRNGPPARIEREARTAA